MNKVLLISGEFQVDTQFNVEKGLIVARDASLKLGSLSSISLQGRWHFACRIGFPPPHRLYLGSLLVEGKIVFELGMDIETPMLMVENDISIKGLLLVEGDTCALAHSVLFRKRHLHFIS